VVGDAQDQEGAKIRSAQREFFLQGKARRPYSHTSEPDRSLTQASGREREREKEREREREK